jgi:hypothetical protein
MKSVCPTENTSVLLADGLRLVCVPQRNLLPQLMITPIKSACNKNSTNAFDSDEF